MTEKLYTMVELIDLTGLSERTIRKHIKDTEDFPAGKIKGMRVFLYDSETLKRLLQLHTPKTPATQPSIQVYVSKEEFQKLVDHQEAFEEKTKHAVHVFRKEIQDLKDLCNAASQAI